MGGDGVLNQEWDLYLFSVCFSFPSSPWSLASDAIWGGGRLSSLMSFLFKKKRVRMCETGVQLSKQSVYSPMPPLSVKTGPCRHRKLAAVQLHCLWKVYDDTVAMVTWATPLLSFPAGTLWADPFLRIGVCSTAPTQNGKLLWFLLWFLLWWYVPNDLLNAVC